jgi:hypothetical protein
LRGDEVRRLPYLGKQLEVLLGFSADITQDGIELTKAASIERAVTADGG